MYKDDLALNNLQGLMYIKTQQTIYNKYVSKGFGII